MFVEVNDLKYVIVRVPATTGPTIAAFSQLAPSIRCAFLISGRIPKELARVNDICMTFDRDFLHPLKSNIKRALTTLDAQPFEAVYVTFDR